MIIGGDIKLSTCGARGLGHQADLVEVRHPRSNLSHPPTATHTRSSRRQESLEVLTVGLHVYVHKSVVRQHPFWTYFLHRLHAGGAAWPHVLGKSVLTRAPPAYAGQPVEAAGLEVHGMAYHRRLFESFLGHRVKL